MTHHWIEECPSCGGLPGGEASGAIDICTCPETLEKWQNERSRLERAEEQLDEIGRIIGIPKGCYPDTLLVECVRTFERSAVAYYIEAKQYIDRLRYALRRIATTQVRPSLAAWHEMSGAERLLRQDIEFVRDIASRALGFTTLSGLVVCRGGGPSSEASDGGGNVSEDDYLRYSPRERAGGAEGDEPSIEQKPYCCPVCLGRGMVPPGFYAAVGVNDWAAGSTADVEKCRSCDGKGIVWQPT